MRGLTIEIDIKFSWGPCFAILRWKLGEVCLHVAVRPSPPYRTWVKDFLAPVTWKAAVTHTDKNLTRLLNLQPVTHEPSSSSSNPPKAGPPPAPTPPSRSFAQAFCQASVSMADSDCQTISPSTRDFGTAPDLIHLVDVLVVHHPVEYYHPPWPVVWVSVIDAFGVIHATLWTMPTPLELVVSVNEYPSPLKPPSKSPRPQCTTSLRI